MQSWLPVCTRCVNAEWVGVYNLYTSCLCMSVSANIRMRVCVSLSLFLILKGHFFVPKKLSLNMWYESV